jgi:hypothetical protein
LTSMPLSADAAARSCFPTSSGSTARHVGVSMASPAESANVSPSSSGVICDLAGVNVAPTDSFEPSISLDNHDLAQLRVGLNQGEKLLTIQLDHLAGLADPQTAECAATADHVRIAGELPGTMAHDQRLAPVGRSKSWSSPLTTTNIGTALSPTSMSTSPAVVDRRRPWAAILETCPEVSVGNRRSERETVTASGVTEGSRVFVDAGIGTALPKRPERLSKIVGDGLWLLPGGEVPSLVVLVVAEELGICPLRPTSRCGVDLV